MKSVGSTNYTPINVDLVLEILAQQFPGQERCVSELFESDPQAREIFENFTECEITLSRLIEAPDADIARLREYRRTLEELKAEICEVLDKHQCIYRRR